MSGMDIHQQNMTEDPQPSTSFDPIEVQRN